MNAIPDREPVQASITGFWNIVAPHYEGHPGNTVPFGSAAHRGWVDLFARVLPQPPADVLDLGTGTGFSALIAASLGHDVVGIDLAGGMLEIARELAAGHGLRVRFEEGDAVAPPFGEATFDAITCRHLLWTLRDAEHALSNWRRLLRPGGRVVALDAFRPRPDPSAEEDPEDIFGKHYPPEVRGALPFLHVQDGTPLVAAFRGAGFVEIAVDLLPPEFAQDGGDGARPYVLVGRAPPAA